MTEARPSLRVRIVGAAVTLAAVAVWTAPAASATKPVAAPLTVSVTGFAEDGYYVAGSATLCTFTVHYVVSGIAKRATYLAELNLVEAGDVPALTNGDMGTVAKADNGVEKVYSAGEGSGWGKFDGSTWNVDVRLYSVSRRGDRTLVASSTPIPHTFNCAPTGT